MFNFLLAATLVFSHQTGKITGTVIEARTGAPLAAVLVKVQSTGQQAFSDADGVFEITDVPVGPQTVLVSVVGYGLVRRDVTVDGTNAVNVTIPVSEGASTYVESVSVGGSVFREGERGVATQSVLGSHELLALRGLIADDPFRAVQMLPGVATGDDFRAEFALRGLGPGHTGISVDGVDSPLLYHTVRGVQDTGSLALINSDILESATLLAGPHPQRLNTHLGSRVDFTTRDGSRERLAVRAMVSASAATTVWEGPVGASRQGSWLFAARRSYIDWLLEKIDTTSGTAFGFTDAQAKLALDLSPRQSLRISMIGGQSVLREKDEDPGPNTLERALNNSIIANVQWRFTPSASFTTAQQVYVVNANYRNRVVDGRTREEGSDRDLTWRGSASWNPKAGHLVEFGGQAQSVWARRLDRRFTSTAEQLVVDATGDAWSAAAWGHYRWTPTARVAISPGVRVDRWQLSDQTKASPWLLTEFQVLGGTTLRLSGGVQHQSVTIDQAMFAPPTGSLGAESAATVEAGLEQRIGAGWRLNLSAYHRRDDDRIRPINAEIRLEGARVVTPSAGYYANTLTGDTSGVELVVERRSVGGLTGWLSYAWSDSQVSDPGGNGRRAETFAADYDQRHTVNTYVAYRWSGRTSLSARFRYGSNFPIVGYVGQDQLGYILTTRRNGTRLPDYARLDLRADRTFTYRKSRLTLFMEVVNATNRDNYRPNGWGVNTRTLRVNNPIEPVFPLLPVAGVLVEF